MRKQNDGLIGWKWRPCGDTGESKGCKMGEKEDGREAKPIYPIYYYKGRKREGKYNNKSNHRGGTQNKV